MYANSRCEHDYRCAGCGDTSQSSEDRKVVQANANERAAGCHAAPDPRMQHASDIARAIITDVSAELPRIDAKAPAGTLQYASGSKTVRAIDFHEGDAIDEAALKALILEAVGLNKSKANRPSVDESRRL